MFPSNKVLKKKWSIFTSLIYLILAHKILLWPFWWGICNRCCWFLFCFCFCFCFCFFVFFWGGGFRKKVQNLDSYNDKFYRWNLRHQHYKYDPAKDTQPGLARSQRALLLTKSYMHHFILFYNAILHFYLFFLRL